VSRTKTTIIAVIALAVTFVAGVAVGVVGDRIFHRRGPMPQFATQALVQRLDRRLELNDVQEKKVAEIIERHHSRIESHFAGVRPRVREEIEQANREIEQVLTPEQRAEFQKMKMRLHLGGRGGRGRKAPTR
jgi:hypothetical protein